MSDEVTQTDTKPQNATFVFGLGGTGFAIVKMLAAMFCESYGKIPDEVRIRVFDTLDQSGAIDQRILKRENLTQLGPFNANSVVQNMNFYREIKRWWKFSGLNPGFIQMGAGAKRPVGRLSFFTRIQQIHAALDADLKHPIIFGKHTLKNPRVFIVCSLGGGTGAGLFLDMAFLCRHMLIKQGYDAGGINIQAILGLPSVVEILSNDGNLAPGTQRRTNTYGALKELDFLLSKGWQDQFELRYPSPIGAIQPQKPVFDQVYLFSAANMDGRVLNNQDDVYVRVARIIYCQVQSQIGNLAEQILVNTSGAETTERAGLHATYGAFGTEWLEAPKSYFRATACAKLAGKIERKIRDFDFTSSQKHDLSREVEKRLTGKLEVYNRAISLHRVDVQTIFGIQETASLLPFFNEIQSAEKPDSLRVSLTQFESNLPASFNALASKLKASLTKEEEDEWVAELAKNLIADKEFRIGGARRVLATASEMLLALGNVSTPASSTLEDVLDSCKRGFFHNKVDSTPAVEWAKSRALQQLHITIRDGISRRASNLAVRCEQLGKELEKLQNVVEEAASALTASAAEVNPQQPQATWLLQPKDIEEAINAHADKMVEKAGDHLSGRIAEEAADMILSKNEYAWNSLKGPIQGWLEQEIQRAIGEHITRPANSVQMLKDRIEQCSPLVRFDTHSRDYLDIMQREEPVPKKIALRGISDPQDLENLQNWARQRSSEQQQVHSYQVDKMPIAEPLRDDVLHVTRGWPLWLFAEVQECGAAAEQLKNSSPATYNIHMTMLEFPGIDAHDIRPVGLDDATVWFGIAIARGDLNIRPADRRFIFETAAFPQEGGAVNPAESIMAAFERFRNYANDYRGQMERAINTKPAEEKARLLDGVQHHRMIIDKVGEALGAEAKQIYANSLAAAEKFANDIFTA